MPAATTHSHAYAYTRMQNSKINANWSLFVARDGIINRLILDDFISSWDEFQYLPNIEQILVKLSNFFKHTFVFTNQPAIDEGLLHISDLNQIHYNLKKDIEYLNGDITDVYCCPHSQDQDFKVDCDCWNTNKSLAHQAKTDHPQVDFLRSIIICSNTHEINFGKRLKMTTVYITSDQENSSTGASLADYVFDSLNNFATTLFKSLQIKS